MTKREKDEEMAPLTDAEASAIQAVSEVERLRRAIETLRPLATSPDRVTDAAWCRAVEAVLAVVDSTTPTARVFTEAEVREAIDDVVHEANSDAECEVPHSEDHGRAVGRNVGATAVGLLLGLKLD